MIIISNTGGKGDDGNLTDIEGVGKSAGKEPRSGRRGEIASGSRGVGRSHGGMPRERNRDGHPAEESHRRERPTEGRHDRRIQEREEEQAEESRRQRSRYTTSSLGQKDLLQRKENREREELDTRAFARSSGSVREGNKRQRSGSGARSNSRERWRPQIAERNWRGENARDARAILMGREDRGDSKEQHRMEKSGSRGRHRNEKTPERETTSGLTPCKPKESERKDWDREREWERIRKDLAEGRLSNVEYTRFGKYIPRDMRQERRTSESRLAGRQEKRVSEGSETGRKNKERESKPHNPVAHLEDSQSDTEFFLGNDDPDTEEEDRAQKLSRREKALDREVQSLAGKANSSMQRRINDQQRRIQKLEIEKEEYARCQVQQATKEWERTQREERAKFFDNNLYFADACERADKEERMRKEEENRARRLEIALVEKEKEAMEWKKRAQDNVATEESVSGQSSLGEGNQEDDAEISGIALGIVENPEGKGTEHRSKERDSNKEKPGRVTRSASKAERGSGQSRIPKKVDRFDDDGSGKDSRVGSDEENQDEVDYTEDMSEKGKK